MRVSSVTLPPLMGTLKSTRTRTCQPDTSTSRTVFLFMAASRLELLGHDRREIRRAARVGPLVVVPGNDLDHRSAQDHRRKAIHDRGARIALEVDRHQRPPGEAGVALHRALGR